MITLERQLSHRYRAGWAHLNPSVHVGTAQVLRSKHRHNRSLSVLRVTSTETSETVIDSIFDTLRQGCQCEHDCGCPRSAVSRVRALKNNLFAVIEHHYTP